MAVDNAKISYGRDNSDLIVIAAGGSPKAMETETERSWPFLPAGTRWRGNNRITLPEAAFLL